MKHEYITVLILLGAALAVMMAWELVRIERTPISDVFHKAFDDGH